MIRIQRMRNLLQQSRLLTSNYLLLFTVNPKYSLKQTVAGIR